MALESPTLEHTISLLSMKTPTKVEPLQLTLISDSVSPFCNLLKTLGMLS